MNEMYDMGIVTHNYGVIGILGTILVNILMLMQAKDIKKYVRAMTLFMPIAMTIIGTVIFTGVIMMAAKHLDFTLENILMILFAIVLIILENIRSKKLHATTKDAFNTYKLEAFKIYAIEIALVLSIATWMWI